MPLLAPLAGTSLEPLADLPAMGLGEQVIEDYRATGLSLKRHPLALLRRELAGRRIVPNAQLLATPAAKLVKVSGLVLVRQQPGSAKGVIFMTLEDETGIANIVVWRKVFERFRPIVMGARLVEIVGRVQREGEVIHVVADRLVDLSRCCAGLPIPASASPRNSASRAGISANESDHPVLIRRLIHSAPSAAAGASRGQAKYRATAMTCKDMLPAAGD